MKRFILGLSGPLLIIAYLYFMFPVVDFEINSDCGPQVMTIDLDFEKEIKDNYIGGYSLYISNKKVFEYILLPSESVDSAIKLSSFSIFINEKYETIYAVEQGAIEYIRTDTLR